ncbi:hypothetical protein HK098_000786 [Nowakowskiella sp. JEL0407]|nr:hypothetical protein HK098_000786 [Nowakowskiella sp. JEL0407]
MGRTNPVGVRIKHLSNWPSNVRHPFLTKYVKHVFQNFIIGEPHIRASTNRIQVNLTVFEPKDDFFLKSHPFVKPTASGPKRLSFREYDLEHSLGRFETRIKNLSDPKIDHFYYRGLFANASPSPLAAIQGGTYDGDVLKALQIFKDLDITFNVNVVKNPLLSASVFAEHVSRFLRRGNKLPRYYATLLRNMHK